MECPKRGQGMDPLDEECKRCAYLSHCETTALAAIDAWLAQGGRWHDRLQRLGDRSIGRSARAVLEAPHVGQAMARAAGESRTETATALLSRGANLNAKDNGGSTPLHWATWNGNPEIGTVLIAAGADVHARDKGGASPLHKAAQEGHTAIADLLLERGADVNARDERSHTPLRRAIKNGHTETVALLRLWGAVE